MRGKLEIYEKKVENYERELEVYEKERENFEVLEVKKLSKE